MLFLHWASWFNLFIGQNKTGWGNESLWAFTAGTCSVRTQQVPTETRWEGLRLLLLEQRHVMLNVVSNSRTSCIDEMKKKKMRKEPYKSYIAMLGRQAIQFFWDVVFYVLEHNQMSMGNTKRILQEFFVSCSLFKSS